MAIEVQVVLGSESDKPYFLDSGAPQIFRRVGINWSLSIVSAHRNPIELDDLCEKAVDNGVQVFIAGAGMAAALPGVIASKVRDCQVIGVALPSTEMPDAQDALYSIVRMPPGIPVLSTGIGKGGFKNAAIAACQNICAVRSTNPDPRSAGLLGLLKDLDGEKPALLDVATSYTWER